MASKRVQFRPHPVFGVEENSPNIIYDDEIDSLWLTAEEESRNKAASEQLEDEPADPLPSPTSPTNNNTKVERFAIWRRQEGFMKEFLAEQARQKEEDGAIDPELLAEILQPVSAHRHRMAHLQGLRDAYAVAGTSEAGTRHLLTPDQSKKDDIKARQRLRRAERRGIPLPGSPRPSPRVRNAKRINSKQGQEGGETDEMRRMRQVTNDPTL